MRVARFVLLCSIAMVIASCGSPSAPTVGPAPDVRGVWGPSGTLLPWRWTLSSLSNPGSVESTSCDGVLDISSQDGNSFSGRFTVACASGRSSGSIRDGSMTGTGRISFRLVTEEGPDPGVPIQWNNSSCRVTDPQSYEGAASAAPGGVINASRVQTMNCPSGPVQIAATFLGGRR